MPNLASNLGPKAASISVPNSSSHLVLNQMLMSVPNSAPPAAINLAPHSASNSLRFRAYCRAWKQVVCQGINCRVKKDVACAKVCSVPWSRGRWDLDSCPKNAANYCKGRFGAMVCKEIAMTF